MHTIVYSDDKTGGNNMHVAQCVLIHRLFGKGLGVHLSEHVR